MWNNQNLKSVMFIHNDDVKCFHMVVQGTHKLVMMGHVNFKDHALIKRQRANEKMNLTGGMLKDEKNMIIVESKLRLLLEVVCVFEVLEFITI
jgi:hypothetical protein